MTQRVHESSNADADASGSVGPNVSRNAILAVLVIGAFVIILNQTLLNTALPTFEKAFDIGDSKAQWLTTIFMLVNGIMIPITAFLIEKFTTRTLFLTAMITFIVGTVICSTAPGFPVLVIGRIVQAAGGGIMIPLMQTILFAIFPLEKRGSAMGTFGLVIAFAPAIGPSLSGWIVDNYPWQTLFIMVLPFAVIATAIAYFLLKNVSEQTHPKLDMLSIIMSSIGFGGLLYGVSEAGMNGWGQPLTLAPLAVGIVTLVVFTLRQLRLEHPILEFRVFRNAMFTLNTALGMCVFMAMIGGMTLLPLYMQNFRDFSALDSGLALLPGAVVMGLMSPITGRLFDRFGAKWLGFVGFIIVTTTTLMYMMLDTESTFWFIALVNVGRMFGTAMVIMPLTTAALNELPRHLIPHGTAMNNTMRQVSAALGTAILVTVMTNTARDPREFGPAGLIHGVDVAFLVAGIISALGIVGSLFIRRLTTDPNAAPQQTVPVDTDTVDTDTVDAGTVDTGTTDTAADPDSAGTEPADR